jgi:DNA polymerase I
LLLVDGHAYAYRAFHAIRSLNSPSGAPTNAIFGFIKMLGRLQAQVTASHWAVVWDAGLAAERTAEWPAYKENRPPMPADLEQQLPGMTAWLEASRCRSLRQEGVEADDWIASLARRAAGRGASVVIASSDKDFMQLVGTDIGLFNPNDKTEKIWQADDVRARTGVDPEQIVDWLSLIGDTVDNIPGVRGVGPKTATALLQQFGAITVLYERLGETKPERVQASLRDAETAVRRNQRLIRLKEDAGEDVPLELMAVQPADVERLRVLYAEWGFRSLLGALPQGTAEQGFLW